MSVNPQGRLETRRLVAVAIVVAGTVASILPQAHAAVQAQFGPATNFPAGNFPGTIVAADFDGDGKADVLVASSGGVSLLLGTGNGALATPTSFPVPGIGPDAPIAVGDFNNDGNPDIVVVANSSGATVSLLLGDGKGNFLVKTNLTGYYSYATSVAAADFNRDGNLDLAIAYGSSDVAVVFGRGDGSFALSTNLTLGSSIYNYGDSIRVGDIYGHGKTDLAVSVSAYAKSNCFCVYSNKGDGTFAGPQYYAAGGLYENHYSLELGDFGANGRQDVAVLNYYARSVTVWVNGGNGAFTPAHEYALGFSAKSIAKGDFNGDGRIDLVVRGGGVAVLLLGNGDGSFTIGPQLTVSTYAYTYGTAVAVADFNGDGMPDLAFANYLGNSVAIMLNETPPTLGIAPLGGYNQISWLATLGADFTLEYTTNLLAPGSWQPFPYPPVFIGNQKAVADWADGEQKYYRLRKQ
jgi:hypothetical protein